jgi:hypothetical protein
MTKSLPAGDELVNAIRSNLPAVEGETYPLDARELAVLEIIRAVANDVAALETLRNEQELFIQGSKGQQRLNPLWAEIRLQRASLRAHIESLKVPTMRDVEQRVLSLGRKSPRHQRAANTRWSREARLDGWVGRTEANAARGRERYPHLRTVDLSADRFADLRVESLDPKIGESA